MGTDQFPNLPTAADLIALREALEAVIIRLPDQGRTAMISPRDGHLEVLSRAKAAYAARRARDAKFADEEIFGEPAWDILLDLFINRIEQTPVAVSSACIAAHVPPTTALRWLQTLESKGFIERHDDPFDRRRSFVRLTDCAYNLVYDCFAAGTHRGG